MLEKSWSLFFGLKLCFRAGLVLLRSKDLGSEVPVVSTALIIKLHQHYSTSAMIGNVLETKLTILKNHLYIAGNQTSFEK